MRQLCAALAASLAACTPEPPPACITVDTSCSPLYAPTFDNIYTMMLRDTCGSQRSSCHSAAGRSGGMSFEDEQHAYDALLAGRVVPGDPLGPAERCALIQWIQAGAPAPDVGEITARGAP